MSVGAKDRIDELLVRKYAKERMDKETDAEMLSISPDVYWKYAHDMAQVQWALVKVTAFLKKKQDEKEDEKDGRRKKKDEKYPQMINAVSPA